MRDVRPWPHPLCLKYRTGILIDFLMGILRMFCFCISTHPHLSPSCNHACKDKTKCRHIWYVQTDYLISELLDSFLSCREGVGKPPPRPKNLKPALSAASQSKLINAQNHSSPVVTETKSKPSKSHLAAILDNLETTSKNHRITGNLSTPRKQTLMANERTTGTSRIPAKRKRPREPTNIKFFDERDLDNVNSSQANAQHSVLKILEAVRPPSPPADDFSDDEMDAIIRDIPLDDICASMETSNRIGKDSVVNNLLSREISAQPGDAVHSSKRVKVNKNRSESTGWQQRSISSDEVSNCPEIPLEADLTINQTLYETPRTTTSPCKDVILDLTLDDDDDDFALDSQLINVQLDSLPSLQKVETVTAPVEKTMERPIEKDETFYDPLAEFEAWLQSGAVEIVD
jgi:hypothetical protein